MVEFIDILSGQQFDFPTDAMDRLEESAIGPIGVPLEIHIGSSSVSFRIFIEFDMNNIFRRNIRHIHLHRKGNFGIRQMESVNNILNIVGKFNDFVIPVGPSGDSPVSFDILSGQQFDFPKVF